MRLSLSPSETVCRLKRLRLAGGVPMAIELATIPTRHLPDPALVIDSLYAAMTARGVSFADCHVEFERISLADALDLDHAGSFLRLARAHASRGSQPR